MRRYNIAALSWQQPAILGMGVLFSGVTKHGEDDKNKVEVEFSESKSLEPSGSPKYLERG